MKHFLRVFQSVCLFCALLVGLQSPAAAHKHHYHSQSAMIAAVKPGIVNITVMRQASNTLDLPPSKRHGKRMTVGSGVIVNAKQGIIITNAHVIVHQQMTIVTLQDGRRFFAKVIGMDQNYDLAVIQIHAKDLIAIPFANPNSVKVGQHVFAIGSPFGLSETVTSGVVSALNRNALSTGSTGLQNLIQTDAPINMGNSGGGLINSKGELIGINTAIISPNNGSIGIGFAIPSDLANAAAHQLAKFGKIKAGQLGVMIQNNTVELARALHRRHQAGAFVSEVMTNSAAAAAKIKMLDVILFANGNRIHNANELKNLLGVTAPGQHVRFVILRGKKTLKLDATIKAPTTEKSTLAFWRGVALETTTHLNAGEEKPVHGIRVMLVKAHSQASLAGLFAGDIITAVEQQPTHTLKQLIKISKHAQQRLLVTINRSGTNMFLVIHAGG